MKPRAIRVPLSLLLSKDLTPAAKFLWIRLRFDDLNPRPRSGRPDLIAKRTCLARSTVYEALRRASAKGWIASGPDPRSGRRRWRAVYAAHSGDREGSKGHVVWIPADLIRAAHAVRPQAILCYGLLQALPQYNPRARTGMFKWAELRELTGLHVKTIKRAVRALAEARWISTAQQNRRRPIRFRLQRADEAFREELRRSLERADHSGEALMRSFLALLVDSNDCVDRCRPDFLVNPASGEKLELDRFYPVNRVAFEFNGKQHFEATGRFTKQEVEAQKRRDATKNQICKEKGIALVTVTANDLSLQRMLEKVGALLPRRALRGFRSTIRFLNHRGKRYQRSALEGSTQDADSMPDVVSMPGARSMPDAAQGQAVRFTA